MDTLCIDELLLRWAEELGFAACGVAKAGLMTDAMRHFRDSIEKGYNADMAYLEKNQDIRENPSLLLPGVKSVICLLAPYMQSEKQQPGIPYVASYARGEDYHDAIRKKLREIVRRMKNEIPELEARVFTDSAPLLERAWAREAGLGFIGKNGLLISKEHGIHNLIGIILVSVQLRYSDKKVREGCGNCRRCLDACPTGALTAPYIMDARRCISYQTIESKRLYEEEEFKVTRSGYIFGCDICIDACPWASRGRFTTWPEFSPLYSAQHNKKIIEFSPQDWISLSEGDFKEIFKNSPLKRAGISKIRNNLNKLMTG
ncbi:MAG: tRNA epoxyqueuosine(34) reductase QueG [Rikenellaceae bacterium]|nr:tRNA epoxyqueuosine(34) reductase QueG [Rikenellaceae bacterium]